MRTFGELIQSDKPTLVDFYATWCGPCKLMVPVLKELKEKTGNKLTIVKVDVDQEQDAARKLGIQGVPTLILFQNGAIKWQQSGVMSAQQLLKLLQPFIG